MELSDTPAGTSAPLLTPGFSITTGWQPVSLQLISFADIQTMSAAPDDTLWFGTQSKGLLSYQMNGGPLAWNSVGGGVAITPAPLSSTQVYAATSPQWTGSEGPFTITYFEDGNPTALPDLPLGDQPQQIAAAPDESLWVLAQSGAVYQLYEGSWAGVPLSGFTINQLGLCDAQSAWALGQTGDGPAQILAYDPESGWQVDATFPGEAPSFMAACSDGSVWAVAGTSFYVRAAGQSWFKLSVTVPQAGELFNFTASSRHHAYLMFLNGFDPSVLCLSVGVVDQQPVPWPAMTGGQQNVYNAISLYLTGVENSSVRKFYDDSLASLDDWHTDLRDETWDSFSQWYSGQGGGPPIAEGDWDVVQPQILEELEFVDGARKMNAQVKALNDQIQIVNNDVMPGVWAMVGLSEPSGGDGNASVRLTLEAMFEAALWGIATVFTGAGAFAASAIASLAGSAISALEGTGGQPPSPDNQLNIKYSQLTDTMANLYQTTNDVADTSFTTIVGDWGMLNAVGSAIRSGSWSWPTEESDTLAQAATSAFRLYFYKFLMPARWQIVHTRYGDYEQYPWTGTPAYVTYSEPAGTELGMPVEDIWFCNQLGAGVDLNKDLTPFPDQALMDTIFSDLGVAQADFYKGQNGWALTTKEATE